MNKFSIIVYQDNEEKSYKPCEPFLLTFNSRLSNAMSEKVEN